MVVALAADDTGAASANVSDEIPARDPVFVSRLRDTLRDAKPADWDPLKRTRIEFSGSHHARPRRR